MEEHNLCFCGSGKTHESCHRQISAGSMVAKLYSLQKALDEEIERQRTESALEFKCEKGCSDCCSKCFCVSETEVVQILDWAAGRWTPEVLEELVRKAQAQLKTLESEAPDTAKLVRGRATLNDIFALNGITLPFPCLFLDEAGSCTIYEVRPLACRTHGIGFLNLEDNVRPCSKLPPLLTAWDRYADLTDYADKISAFTFLRYGEHWLVRRPAPLFYFFAILFNDRTREDVAKSDAYRYLTELDEMDYVKVLVRAAELRNKPP